VKRSGKRHHPRRSSRPISGHSRRIPYQSHCYLAHQRIRAALPGREAAQQRAPNDAADPIRDGRQQDVLTLALLGSGAAAADALP